MQKARGGLLRPGVLGGLMALLGCSSGLPATPGTDVSRLLEADAQASPDARPEASPSAEVDAKLRSTALAVANLVVHAQDPNDAHGCEDSAEPNDRRADAWAVSLGERLEGRMCADDVDWIEVELVEGQRAAAQVETTRAERLEAPRVFQPRGRKPLGRTVRSPRAVSRVWTAPVRGKYRIRIDPPRDGGRVDYTVTVTEAQPKDGAP